MSDLQDGETTEIKGSGAKPYVLRNTGGVYSCTCPAWRNQSVAIETRTCKHLRQLRGDAAETARIGHAPADPVRQPSKAASVASQSTSAERQASPAKEPPLLLAHPWDHLTDLAGWWMSEKLDGVRAYWDGSRFISRLGNEYRAPDWFVEGLPKEPLDGELWLDRQMFQRTVSIVRRHDASDHWKEITYLVFDAPALASPFEHRQLQLRSWLGSGLPHARVLDQHVCQGVDHLLRELDRVNGLGGEGLMLRQPQSLYEVGRSTTLYKVKTFLDAEARVVEQLPGEGKHAGRLGALLVEMPDGKRFAVGTGFSDAERRSPPPIGALITYRYQELTDRGVPRFPTYLRVRSDLDPAWEPLAPALAALDCADAKSTRAPVLPEEKPPERSVTEEGRHMQFRRFELVDATSSKYWEIGVEGASTHVRYGRIGANGQSQSKQFGDGALAQAAADRQITEKLRGGYQEVGTTLEKAAASSVSAPAPSPGLSTPVVSAGSANPSLKAKTHPADPKPSKDVTPSTGKTLCISGKLPSGLRKHDYESALAAVGVELVDDVAKGLDYLVLADPLSASSKALKARQLGVKIISEDDLIAITSRGGA